MLAWLLGFALGFFGSIPAAGPLAVAIAAAALAGDRGRARRLALGGAAAECVWAAIALYGVSWAPLGALRDGPWLRALGGGVVALLGVALLRAPERPRSEATAPAARASHVGVGFALVATSPTFLVAWSGSAVLVASLPSTLREPIWAIVVGAYVGVVAWFAILASALGRASARLRPERLRLVVRALGGVLVGLGLALAASSFVTGAR